MTDFMICYKMKCKNCGRVFAYAEKFVGRVKCRSCGLEQTFNFKGKANTKHMGPFVKLEKPSS